jgi:transcription antitermination factor NusG
MSWYCVKTSARLEAQAEFGIQQLGFPTFFPRVRQAVTRERQPWRDGTRIVPMFGTYIFAQFNLIDDPTWPHIIRQPGVVRVMSMPVGDGMLPRPIALDDAVIDTLREAAAASLGKPPAAVPPIPVGSVARITEGPLASLQGIVTWSNDQRVALLMDWMGGQRRVELGRRLVEVV